MMAEAVKVAVRCRPFNQREMDRGAKLIINMDGKMTTIKNPEAPGEKPKEFSFDFSYWSHDKFTVDDNGINIPDASDKYASQRKVFNNLGQGVLDNALKGFNCSLFAYGQTGSGKSYSMVGYGANKGIVPITCDELFKIIEGSKTDTKYQVTFSMLEIYNEQVRDLLTKDNPKGGLTVRQNPKEGAFYVQGLKFVAVGSYKEIEARTEEGTANRTVACTQMNATSSRAHTVVTIQFDQICKNEAGEETKKSSVINLVDLAGSERAESTGATGDRLKEGANINKSLSSLGNVISALADQSSNTGKKIVVPYRDSVLTKLLKNALGGNSKTIMIAALSPADINYDETLSTLRYADRAKKIKTKAVVNENPMEKLIRELKEENDRLKKAMQSGDLSALTAGMDRRKSDGDRVDHAEMSAEEKEKLRKEIEEEIRSQMASNSSAMKTWDEKLEESRQEIGESVSNAKKKGKVPHLVNLNEDSMLSGVIYHFLNKGETRVGRKNTNPDIPLSGLSISNEHALISYNGKEITIKPASNGAKTKVNGILVTGEQKLKHHDRILFGSNHMYYFVNPINPILPDGTPKTVNWEIANKEIAHVKGFATSVGSGLPKDHAKAIEEVLELLPRVSETNAISEELDKKMYFEVILKTTRCQDGGVDTINACVKVTHMLTNNIWVWDSGKFNNRRYMMQDLYQRAQDGEDLSKLEKYVDPFWEPAEDILVGSANVFLQSLAYGLDIEDTLPVTDYKGTKEGDVSVWITPCAQNGDLLNDDEFVDDPADLLGKPYHLKIMVKSLAVSNSRYKHGLYVNFVNYGDKLPTQTQTIIDSLTPSFNFSHIINFSSVTQEHLDWFNDSYLAFNVYAKQTDKMTDTRLVKLTTKELFARQQKQKKGIKMKTRYEQTETSLLKSELILYKRRYTRLLEKEKRIQTLLDEWGKKGKKEKKDYDGFYRAMHAAAHHERGMMKYKVNALQPHFKDLRDGKKVYSFSEDRNNKACSIM